MTNVTTTVKLQSPNYARRVVEDASISSGSTTLESEDADFDGTGTSGTSQTDVGETVIIHGASTEGNDNNDLVTTISSVTDQNTVELNQAADTTVSNAFCRIGSYGREIHLPVEQASYQGQSMATSVPLFNGETLNLDLGQLERGVQFGGAITHKFAEDHHHVSPIYMRDLIRATREKGTSSDVTFQKVVADHFSGEVAPTSSTNSTWDDDTLAVDEQDSTGRSTGTMRLVFDIQRTGNGGTEKYFLYGTVGRYTVQRMGASFRGPFSYGMSFQPSNVATA